MTSTPSSAGEKFLAIGEDVFLRKPVGDSTRREPSNDPNVILVFGWMGAQLPHLHKYTKVYEEIYPDATQILIRTRKSLFWSAESSLRSKLTPAVEALSALGYLPTQSRGVQEPSLPVAPQRILIHSFSNGGAMQLLKLGQVITAEGLAPPLSPNPQSIWVVDSAPGGGTLSGAINAFTAGMKSVFTRWPTIFFISLFFLGAGFVDTIRGQKDILERNQEALLGPNPLPWITKDTPRLYIYSKKDKLVSWEYTQAHIEKVKALGYPTKTEVFEDSPHVAHARMDPVRYWGAIQGLWNSVWKA